MKYTIDPHRDIPIYRQVAESILRDIKTGKLSAGVKLPTVRDLAEETGLCVTEEEMVPLFTRRISDHHIDCYMVRLDKSGDEVRVTMQEGETTEYIWADDADIAHLQERGMIVSITQQVIDYLKSL